MMTPAKTQTIFEALHLAIGAWLITGIEYKRWNRDLVFNAIYDDSREDTVFHVIFKDCQYINWFAMGDEVDAHHAAVDVIGMEIGEGAHRKPAMITTDLFEVSITYGELVIEKDW